MKAEELKNKISRILVKYHTKDSYLTAWAANDLFKLMEAYHQEKVKEHPELCVICKKPFLSDICLTCAKELCSPVGQEKEVVMPSDVQILLESSSHERYKTDERRIGFQQGAKWLRDQLKPVDKQIEDNVFGGKL